MLFRKKLSRSCEYCVHGTKFGDEYFICVKKGVRSGEKPCRKFRYDPCKRIPPRAKIPDFSQYTEDDFSL